MADTEVARKLREAFLGEDFIHEAHIFMAHDMPFFGVRVRDCDAGALLSAMLKRVQAVINRRSYVLPVEVVHAENAASLADALFCSKVHAKTPSCYAFFSFFASLRRSIFIS